MKKEINEKQIHILNVAEELIAQKGFEGTSVRDISAKANVNVAMISYYFGSKDKMMSALYQHRVRKIRAKFSEFAETIRGGKPEMQMKEIVQFLISELFKSHHFHGFVTQELRHNKVLKEELMAFYQYCTIKMSEVVRKGISTGVFTFAPKSEDILTNILGSALFTIRNIDFIKTYLATEDETKILSEAQKKVQSNLLLSVFAVLGYAQEG